MAVFSKKFLSGSSNGQPILVVATADPGTTIHTAVSGSSSIDEIWIYAHNSDASSRNLTIEFGGNTSPNNLIIQSIAGQSGLVLVIPGLPLQNSLVVKAYASLTNVITITGFVNGIV